jgi:hypothetical protein
MNLKEFVTKTSDNLDDRGLCSNPLLILTMVSIAINIARLWVECRKNKSEMYNMAVKPNFTQKILLKRVIKNNLRSKTISTSHTNTVYNALIKTAGNLTEEEFNKLINSIDTE